ncbi:putative HHIP-like protein 1 [Hypsibius exemplaris]|uniref:HHIP-like protein 1 n=1 Tax=Hypsibius exemplaris TaxID=2072580 RepID=A0A1W0WY46_HYPEX|nr:putative HHIP-like protein 1 [Hypsibius exemplaris]
MFCCHCGGGPFGGGPFGGSSTVATALPTRFLCMTLQTDLLQNPVALVQVAPGRLMVAERDGKVQLVDLTSPDQRLSQPEVVLDLSDKVFSKGDHMGLLSITLHPRFRTNGFVFIMYSADTDDREFHHRQLISRFTLSSSNATEIDRFSELVILEIYQSAPTGGQIWFGSDDHILYIAVGDGSRARRRRFDRGSFSGKILRINVDVDPARDGNVPYKIPDDNPFAHQPSTLLPEVFAYGLRNPWRCSEHEQRRESKKGTGTARIVCVDVGSKFSDFNIIQKGGMYGWLDEAFSPCHDLESCRNTTKLKSEFKLPICRYLGIAVGGLIYSPWNAYLFADYLRRSFHYLKSTHSGTTWLRGSVEIIDNATTCGPDHSSLSDQTILNLQQTPDKELYVLTVSTDQTGDEPNGHLYRISAPKADAQIKSVRSRQTSLTATISLILCTALQTTMFRF